MNTFIRPLLCILAFCAITETFANTKQAEWTVLIYISGKNNLESSVAYNLNQLEQVGSTEQINFIVQYATLLETPVKRARIIKDSDPLIVTSPVLENLGEQDLGDYKTLSQFLHWGAEKYPAKHYFVVLWDHGTGWHADIDPPPVTDDISHDEKTNHWISTKELGYVAEDFYRFLGKKIELFTSDACLMASIEVAYELENYVDLYLGSEDIIPTTGWPYHHIAAKLTAYPLMTASEIAKMVSNEYVYYTSAGLEVEKHEAQYSVLDMKQMPAFKSAFIHAKNDLLNLSKTELVEIQKHGLGALHFNITDYVDMGDLLLQFFKHPKLAINTPLQKLQQAYQKLVLHNVASPEFAKSTGASLWMPQTKQQLDFFIDKYKELNFSKDTGWDVALKEMF